MNSFIKGFIKGAKETPVGFFAPAIALWRALVNSTDSLLSAESKDKDKHHA